MTWDYAELGRQIARAVVAAQMQDAVARAAIRLALIDLVHQLCTGPIPPAEMFARGGIVGKTPDAQR